MIVYNLKCHKGHEFEAWFRDSAAFDGQRASGDVRCPSCGTRKVDKALMAPNLGKAKSDAPKSKEPPEQQVRKALAEMRKQVEANCDYVGAQFPEEARKIHYGESDPRGIYGESSLEEAKALEEEGVEVQRIPWLPRES